MTTLIIILACVLAGGIGIPLAGSFMRDRDFKRQVEGKRPERKFEQGSAAIGAGKMSETERKMQTESNMAWLKSKQNLFGPK